MHHIEDYASTQDHSFENLILLCAVCHARVTAGEIDRKAVKAYKANLGVIQGRYGGLERRVLERFVKHPDLTEIIIDRTHQLSLQYLLDEGIIVALDSADGAFMFSIDGSRPPDGDPETFHGPMRWGLTDAGRILVGRYRSAQDLW